MQQWAPELREEAVRHVRSSHETVSSASRHLGVPPSTLRRWLREDRSQRVIWISPPPAAGTVAHPRMVKVLATFAAPSPQPPQPRRQLPVGTLIASVACVLLVGAIALDAASHVVASGTAARGFAAVVLGAALGGAAADLPYRPTVEALQARRLSRAEWRRRPEWILELERLAWLRTRRL
jgi:transposase-like protein